MTAYPRQILPPNYKIQLVDKEGILTKPGIALIQQIWAQIVNTNQVTPCTCISTGNEYDLTVFPVPNAGNVLDYVDYAIFTFVADATSTGTVTAQINALGALPVYNNDGATAAGSGDVVQDSLYFLIYNSALNNGGGGFVLK